MTATVGRDMTAPPETPATPPLPRSQHPRPPPADQGGSALPAPPGPTTIEGRPGEALHRLEKLSNEHHLRIDRQADRPFAAGPDPDRRRARGRLPPGGR